MLKHFLAVNRSQNVSTSFLVLDGFGSIVVKYCQHTERKHKQRVSFTTKGKMGVLVRKKVFF